MEGQGKRLTIFGERKKRKRSGVDGDAVVRAGGDSKVCKGGYGGEGFGARVGDLDSDRYNLKSEENLEEAPGWTW